MSAAAGAVAPPIPDALTLQPLREDLRLHESGVDRDGAPMWAIQDPVTNRFYRIGWLEYECLLRWPGKPAPCAAAIAGDIDAHTPMAVDTAQVEAFALFLEQHQLVRPSAQGMARLQGQANEPGWRHWRWWLHHYLFIRIPLVRPDRLLARLQPLVAPLFSLTTCVVILVASLLGLILVARQWDTFTHSVMDLLTPSGIAGFLIALVISKTFHELGHALVATRLGVRVAHMGVAFIVMWPMLYTDTGESWRLRSHRQRLAISAAGVTVEIALAGLATLAWALLDDGLLRQAMLYLATTGWILSLALNVSPFMRFDGYFILSDILDFPNLHERAGAMARVWLRRHLLGLADADPEPLPPRMRRALVAFAFVTWAYRLVVFLAIAWAVYAFFFKVLGIFMLGVELAWFIVRPAWSEIAVWKRRWSEVRPERRRWLGGVLLGIVLLLAIPWRFDVKAYGMAQPERQQVVYGPLAGRVLSLHGVGDVRQGTVLLQLAAPELEARANRSGASVQALNQRLSGLIADDEGLDRQAATREQLQEQLAESRAVHAEAGRLQVEAAFDGIWRDVDPVIRPGVWLSMRDPVGVLVDPRQWIADVYVEQRSVHRVEVGAHATFYPQGQVGAVRAEVLAIDSTRSLRLTHAMLDARHGGKIATQANERDPVPVDAVYRVRLRLMEPISAGHEVRGSVQIDGARKSLAWEATKSAIAVLIRESGF